MLFAVIFTLLSMTAFPQAGEKWSVGGNSISATGFLGTLNNFPINFKTNNVQRMTLTTAGFLGLGTAAPTVMFECTGNGKINNFKVNAILTVGNKISVSKIFSPAGIIDFEGSNLKTTAGISGASLAISGNGTFGNISANSFQNPLFAGAGSGLLLSDANGSFQKLDFDGNQNTFLRGDGTFGFMPVNDAWKTVNGNIYTTGNFNVGIGIDSPIEKLDVNGNANIRGYLYVQDGVIIGKRIDGQRVNSDTIDVKQLAIKYATTDSLTSLKLATGKMAVTQDINIGERAKIGTNIVIDGLTNNITTPGSITAGNITAVTMNVANQSITNLNVSGGIKVGNSSIILGTFADGGAENNIYTQTDNLYIQSNLYNAAGKVCIGTTNPDPFAKLDVSGNIQINNNDIFLRNSHHGLGWYGDATASGGLDKKFSAINIDGPVLYGWNGGALGSKYFITEGTELENIALRWTRDGNVGIGTSSPTLAKLHVKDDLSPQVLVIEGGETGTYMSWYHENRQAWAGFYTNDNFELKNETPNGHILLSTTGTGKIGIGTYTPTEKLHIKDGSIYIDGEGQGLIVNEGGHKRVGFMKYANHEAGIWRVQNQDFEIGRLNSVDMLPGYPSITDFLTDIYIANDGKIGFGTNDPSESFEVYGNGNISLRGSGNDAGDIIFKNNNPASQLGRIWTNSDSQSGLFLSSGDVTPDITIKNDGFVGIGTTNPSEKLTVKGKILAAEFEIQKYDDIPDYVFAPDYKLLSLQEIEKYVKQNQHLPDVPSAKDFEKNGINLGEMNFILLKKVEELTLHMIQLQKKNEQLEKIIETLKK